MLNTASDEGSMNLRVLKSEEDHREAMLEVDRLMAMNPAEGSREAERLEVLGVLLEEYERKVFDFGAVDPIEAIEFRMAEQGLKQKDLVPLIGSRSRVSEILSRKRPLTVAMIRSLSSGLGIPAEMLLGPDVSPSDTTTEPPESLDWAQFPYGEMERRGWFNGIRVSGTSTEERLKSFLQQVAPKSVRAEMLFRTRLHGEVTGRGYYSVLAWSTRVLVRGKNLEAGLPKFDVARLSAEVLRDLARLSWFKEGPKLAIEFLAKLGIVVVVEPRLPNAVFDGAAMLSSSGVPVIGLTMRLDRVDYFWFTLLHEVAHVWRHLNDDREMFVDRIEAISDLNEVEAKEREANRIARDAFIRRADWERAPVRVSPSKAGIQELADKLHIHPAIIAGRIQFETGKYEIFREFLGQGQVAKLLAEVAPPKE